MSAAGSRDPDADGWERSDFPIVCDTCLGPNPYVRMQRIPFGGQCHVSGRPYTVFRWKPGAEARYKKTIICQEVAKAKNVCQVCLLDLSYGVPVAVRDQLLGVEADPLAATSAVGREWALTEAARAGTLGQEIVAAEAAAAAAGGSGAGGGAKPAGVEALERLAARQPYYERNKAKICTFFAKGQCSRGAACPYRHDLPSTGPLSKQHMTDRYHGVNDPVADKLMAGLAAKAAAAAAPPADTSITTLYVGGLAPAATEGDVRDAFSPFGELAGVRRVDERGCAFVTFAARPDAERAARALAGKLVVRGSAAKLLWGKPAPGGGGGGGGAGPSAGPPPPPPVAGWGGGGAGPRPAYASMDPTAQGARLPGGGGGGGGGGWGGGGPPQGWGGPPPGWGGGGGPPGPPPAYCWGPPPPPHHGWGGGPPAAGPRGPPPPSGRGRGGRGGRGGGGGGGGRGGGGGGRGRGGPAAASPDRPKRPADAPPAAPPADAAPASLPGDDAPAGGRATRSRKRAKA